MHDRRLTWGFAALCAAAAVSAVACGSSSTADVVPADDGGAGDGSAGGDGGSTSNADGASTFDGGGTTDDAGGNGDGGTPPSLRDAGIFTDAAPAITGDGGAADDAGPGGSVSQISCGSTSCALATDFCCVYDNKNAPPDFLFTCASGSACPNLAGGKDPTALGCSSAANCPTSTVCCIRDDGNRIWSECSATCTDTGSITAAQLCDPNAASTGCPTSDPCSNNSIGDWKLPDGFATCGGRGN